MHLQQKEKCTSSALVGKLIYFVKGTSQQFLIILDIEAISLRPLEPR